MHMLTKFWWVAIGMAWEKVDKFYVQPLSFQCRDLACLAPPSLSDVVLDRFDLFYLTTSIPAIHPCLSHPALMKISCFALGLSRMT